ncbi:MAG: FAD-dependent oxidoreductase [Solirubrobacterales bacterium]|nr:FAD-dependent oxidoreductase [Solirubrobacterales bacterium]
MAKPKPYHVAIIGLGSAGLTAARTAAELGLSVIAVERARAGGDCLWSGCVPSKTLIASGRVAAVARDAERFGISTGEVTVDRGKVWSRIRQVREEIALADDNLDRYRELGVDIREGPAKLVGTRGISVGGEFIPARRMVIATGSRPRIPLVEGLAAADPLTADTLWDLPAPPEDLIILGAGPSGVEIAQAMARIGTRVRLIHRNERILPKEDPILAEVLEERLTADGVEIIANATPTEAAQVESGTRRLTVEIGPNPDQEETEERSFEAPHLLVCCGRSPNFESLGIEGAGIDHGDNGILADDRSRTSAKQVYAVGDVAGRGHTHTAGYDAAQAIRDIALPGPGRRAAGVPWTTFTDPELGHAGLTFADALAKFPRKRVQRYERDLAGSDRSRTDGDPPGRAVVITVGGRVAGVHLLAPGAGEAIGGFQREIINRTKLVDLAGRIEAYPTRAIEVQQIAGDGAIDFARRVRAWIPKRPGTR